MKQESHDFSRAECQQLEGGFFTDENDRTVASDEIYIAQVKDIGDDIKLTGGNIFTGENEPTHDASIKIKKLDDDRNPLEGAHFQLKNSKGEVVVEDAVSDKDGIVTFEELYPDTYTITETQGVKGHMLLAEPLVVDVPTRLTEAEIREQNVDRDKVIYDPEDNIYYVNNLVYEISNAWKLDMPVTGAIATPKTFFPIVIGLSIMAVTAYFGIFRRRRDDVLED